MFESDLNRSSQTRCLNTRHESYANTQMIHFPSAVRARSLTDYTVKGATKGIVQRPIGVVERFAILCIHQAL